MLGKRWESCRKFVGQCWESGGKVVEKLWDNAETVVGNELCKNIAGIQAVVNVKYEYTAESHTISVRVQLSFHEESCKLWINIQTF